MKKPIAWAIGIVWLAALAGAQEIIQNPATPPAPNAGRVVTVKEEMRIEDTGEGFYLKAPMGIRVAPDGTIFVKDGQEQVLQFSPQGKFIRNIMKKGQGPGEVNSVFEILVSPEGILLHGTPPKILVFDFKGNFLREIGLQALAPGFARIFSADGDSYFFWRSGRPDPKQGTGWKDIPQEVFVVSEKDKESRTIGTYPIPSYVQTPSGGGISVMGFKSLLISPYGRLLALNETPEYSIKFIDPETGKVIRHFRRNYARVKLKRQSGIRTSAPSVEAPELSNDINFFHEVDGTLWVQTSTADAKKGILFDVFDSDGRYVDNFFLKYSDRDIDPNRAFKMFTFAGGFVYYSDTTEDDLVVVKKGSLVGLK
jgi:hypothetical protein